MIPLSSLYTIIMITAVLICISITAYIWPYRHTNSEATPLIHLLMAIAIWVLSALLGFMDQHLVHKLLWAKVEYIGVTSVPLALLRYVSFHFEPGESLLKKRLPWFAIFPAIILILAWTNEYHGLIWASYTPYLENGMVLSQKTYGDAFWIYWVYSYVLVIISAVITIRFALLSANIFRWQSFFILAGILAPFVGNFLYVLKLNPFGDLDLTPLAFSITSISYAIGMFRSNLFEFKPIAQEAAIAGMTDGLLVLDHLGRILDVNPAAEEILGFEQQTLVGKQIEDVFAEWLPDYDVIGHDKDRRTDVRIGVEQDYRNFEVSDLPFYEKSGMPGGRIVLLHDTTHIKSLEDKLKEMERKHAQAILQQVEDKFAMLYQNMSVGVIYWNMDGKAIDMNPAAEEILRIDSSRINEALSAPDRIKVIREDGSVVSMEQYPNRATFSTGKPVVNQVLGLYYEGEGNYRWVIFNSIPLYRPGESEPYQVFSTLEDITERKRAEQEIVNLSRFPTENPNPVLRVQIDGRVIYGNNASNELLEMWETEVAGYLPSDLQELISELVETGSNKRVDVPCGHKVYSMTFVPVPDSGYVNIYALDVTDRKQTEDRLRESRETLRVILNAVSESILMIDSEGETIITNETVAQRVGTPTSDIVGKNIFDFLPEELAKERKKWVELAAREKKVVQFEDQRFGAWVENNVYPLIDEDGDVRRFVIYGRDITSQKQAEKAIQESMLDARQKADALRVVNQIGQKVTSGLELDQLLLALYEECKQLWNINQFYISLYDEETEMISFPFNYLNGKPAPIASRKNHTVVGFTEYILEHLETLYIPDTYLLPEEGWLRRNLKDPTRSYIGVPLMINDRVVGVLSMQSHSPDAYSPEQIQMLELLTTQTAIAIQNAQLFQQANQEIAERIQTEKKLLISNERFSRVFNSSPNPISISRLTNNQLIDMNEAWENLTGWNKEDAIGKSALDLDAWVDPHERERLKTLLTEQGTVHGFEMQMRTRSGKVLNLLMSAEIISLENEPCMLVMSQDITELISTREDLRKSEERFHKLVENAPIAISISRDRKVVYGNRAYLQMFGAKTLEEMVGLPLSENFAPGWREQVAEYNDLRRQGLPAPMEYESVAQRRDGTQFPVFIAVTSVVFSEGNSEVAFFTDITESKYAELEKQTLLEIVKGLAYSEDMEEFLSLVHLTLGRVIPAESFFVSLYDDAKQVFEDVYSVDDHDDPIVLGQGDKSLVSYIFRTGEPFLSSKERIEELVAAGEVELVGTDSHSFLGVPLIAYNKPIGVMVVQDYKQKDLYSTRDLQFMMRIAGQVALAIQRKVSSDAQIESEERFRTLIEQSSEGVALVDTNGNILEWNPAMEEITGLSKAESLHKPIWEIQSQIVSPENRKEFSIERLKNLFLASLQSGEIPLKVQHQEVEIQMISGERKIVTQSVFMIKAADGYRLGSIVRDITERKIREEKNRAQLRELQRWYTLSLNREDRILELKREVNDLLRGNDQAVRYLSAEDQPEGE